MATKIKKNNFPAGHSKDDFECFGPVATEDGEFSDVMMADLGCFRQDGVDSNKAYHGAVCKSTKNGLWYAYFEWGRTGRNGDIQFIECVSQAEAQQQFAKQMHAKNDKRGEWVTKPGLGRILQSKAGKDCYLVRPMATRGPSDPGLPDARRVTCDDGAKKSIKKTATKSKGKAKKTPSYDRETIKLMSDLNVATVNYTKSNMQGGAIPTQRNIDLGRDLLSEAQKRLAALGGTVQDQVNDHDLRQITYQLYSRIPKVKPLNAPESDWILSQDNVFAWRQDLDAYESALYSQNIIDEDNVSDPFGGMNITMKHCPPNSTVGEFIRSWMPKASRNRHGYLGDMRIKNVWEFEQHGVQKRFDSVIDDMTKSRIITRDKAMHQPRRRNDLSDEQKTRYSDANVAMLFHGTRSVNVSGILREGLRMPRQLVGVVITGAMFGPGIYWADDWKKSAGYCSLSSSYWASGDGKVKGRQAFMFVADVALGKPHVASGPRGYTSPPRGCHSVFGAAGRSGVQNNEWIVYKPNQNRLRYLVEFTA